MEYYNNKKFKVLQGGIVGVRTKFGMDIYQLTPKLDDEKYTKLSLIFSDNIKTPKVIRKCLILDKSYKESKNVMFLTNDANAIGYIIQSGFDKQIIGRSNSVKWVNKNEYLKMVNNYKDENKTNKTEVNKMNKYELELQNELLSGRVVRLVDGRYGLITDTPNFGKLVGFYGEAVRLQSLLDEGLIESVYNITNLNQILGLGVHEDYLELVYQVVPTITTIDQLKKLLEDNEIYVNIDIRA